MLEVRSRAKRRLPLRPVLCGLVIGCCTVAGCGSGASPVTGERSGPGSDPPAAACDLVTSADVADVSGTPAAAGDEMVGDEAGITACRYAEVLVRFSPHLGSENADLNRPAGASEVPGLGDAAYSYPDTTTGYPQNVLSVVTGSAQLYMVSMDLSVDQLVELARRGLARIR